MRSIIMIVLIMLALFSGCKVSAESIGNKEETAMEKSGDNMEYELEYESGYYPDTEKKVLIINRSSDYNKLENGDLTINDLIYIDGTYEDGMLDKLGTADAIDYCNPNHPVDFPFYIYKLADGGIFKIRFFPVEYYAYIVYPDVIIVLYAPEHSILERYTEDEGVTSFKYLTDREQ